MGESQRYVLTCELKSLLNRDIKSHFVFRTRLERVLVRVQSLNEFDCRNDLRQICKSIKEKLCCGFYGDDRRNEREYQNKLWLEDDIQKLSDIICFV